MPTKFPILTTFPENAIITTSKRSFRVEDFRMITFDKEDRWLLYLTNGYCPMMSMLKLYN